MNTRRVAAIVAVVIGAGLALAPVGFQMFTRAPKGGDMIVSFRPYMTEQKISTFQGYLKEIGAADVEAAGRGLADNANAIGAFHNAWPGIDDDMGDMLTTMGGDIKRFLGVSALPPFALFPFFFVVPGLFGVIFGVIALRRLGRGESAKVATRLILVLGVGLLAAPAIFQMFSRAPGGKAMIDDFRPLMTEAKVTNIQGYFLTLGAAEGQFRNEVLSAKVGTQPAAQALPAVAQFSRDWPRISNEMAPMIGTMADNLDNFAAVDALPPFSLFPWFFVIPGLILIGAATPALKGSASA